MTKEIKGRIPINGERIRYVVKRDWYTYSYFAEKKLKMPLANFLAMMRAKSICYGNATLLAKVLKCDFKDLAWMPYDRTYN